MSAHRAILAATFLLAALPAHAADGVFHEPRRVCDALAAEGLQAGPWTSYDDAFGNIVVRNWRCLSQALPIREGATGLPVVTSLNYFAEGRTRERVERVKLVLNVHDPGSRGPGKRKFIELAQALFRNLGLGLPEGLATALRDDAPGRFVTEWGSVRFDRWTAPIERLRLTLEATGHRPARSGRR